MTQEARILEALAPVKAMLEVDDYRLHVRMKSPSAIIAEIRAGPDACPACLVPKTMMTLYFEKALVQAGATGISDIELVYPTEID